MLVTMFTDASLIDQTRSGGWALWAKSERGVSTAEGPLKGAIVTSGEAELKAIANGIHYLVVSKALRQGDTLLVQADNTQALGCVRPNGKRPTMCAEMRKAAAFFDDLVAQYDITVRVRHVKAHSGVGKPRLWVHDNCDRRARKCARALHSQRDKGWYHAELQKLQA